MNDFRKTLNEGMQEFGLSQIEIGPLGTPLTIAFYETWLQENLYGSMTYLKDHYELKKNPQALHENLRSVISIAQSYYPAVTPVADKNPARVALYAQNLDYHYWLKDKLQKIIAKLQAQFPNEIFLPYVDSGPILERNWAYQNRMGWFGKNTCLIHPDHGSLFFIAEILTSISNDETPALEPLPDFCGKCTKCIEICPTQALVSPRKMQADRCISYLTIEAKEPATAELRPLIGDWFFGCDLCQTVCPWNQKVFRTQEIAPAHENNPMAKLPLNNAETAELIRYFRWLLTASHKQIQKTLLGSPLNRAGAKGLKRNALIVIANRGLVELKPEVQALEFPALEELKIWTLERLQAQQGSV